MEMLLAIQFSIVLLFVNMTGCVGETDNTVLNSDIVEQLLTQVNENTDLIKNLFNSIDNLEEENNLLKVRMTAIETHARQDTFILRKKIQKQTRLVNNLLQLVARNSASSVIQNVETKPISHNDTIAHLNSSVEHNTINNNTHKQEEDNQQAANESVIKKTTNDDNCASNPCGNKGNCTVTKQSPYYMCQCGAAFTGRNCQVKICFMEQYVNDIGSVRYNMGCRDSQQCSTIHKRRQIDVNARMGERSIAVICTDCCRGNVCNSGGCGIQPFPENVNHTTRGPICFTCDQQSQQDDCNTIQQCSRDEVCQLVQMTISTTNEKYWRTACYHKDACIHEYMDRRRRSMFYVSGGIPCSRTCCQDDLCNNICPEWQ